MEQDGNYFTLEVFDFKQTVSIDCSVLEIEINLIRQLIEADNGGGQRGHRNTHSKPHKPMQHLWQSPAKTHIQHIVPRTTENFWRNTSKLTLKTTTLAFTHRASVIRALPPTHENMFTEKSTLTKTAVLVQEKRRQRRVEGPKNLNGEKGNISQRL